MTTLSLIEAAGETEALGRDDMLTAGITYRQLDYWCRKGYLRPYAATPGSGNYRRFPATEGEIARLMLLLIIAGVEPEAAARAAREGVEQGQPYGLLNDTVAVLWVDHGGPVSKQAPPPEPKDRRPSAAEVAAAYAGLERHYEEGRPEVDLPRYDELAQERAYETTLDEDERRGD